MKTQTTLNATIEANIIGKMAEGAQSPRCHFTNLTKALPAVAQNDGLDFSRASKSLFGVLDEALPKSVSIRK